jgi:hypothetical protein
VASSSNDDIAETMKAIDAAYEESRQAINEGRAVLEEIAGDSADTIMADETAHRKRSAQDDDVEESNK